MRRIATISAGGPDDLLADERGPRADARRNREAIVTAARELARGGRATFTIAEVAARAGVGKGTVHRHFADVGLLYLAVLDGETLDLQRRWLGLARDDRPALGRAAELLADLAEFNLGYLGLLLRAPRSSPTPNHVRAGGFQRQALLVLLHQAARRGELDVDVDVDHVVDVLLAGADPALLAWQTERAGHDLDRIVVGLARLVAGLGAPVPAPVT